jgi:hypothetical protein
MKTYVLLNRLIGNTSQRADSEIPWEMILPIKQKDSTFKAPKSIGDHLAGFAFKKYLERGETILVNANGGWNMLSKTDHIIKMWQE